MCMFVSVEDLRLVAKMICMILLKAKFGGHVVGCFDLAGQDKIELPCGVREVYMNAAFELDFQGGVCNVVG